MSSVPDPKGLEGRKEGQSQAPQSRDFLFDSITLYVVAVILALAAIDVVTEYVRESHVQCYPNDTDSTLSSKAFASVQDYVNEFCTGRLPSLQYLPALIAVHAIFILVPHYVWLNAYGADLDFFFTHASKLKRTREVSTGDYHEMNYIISQQLENAFFKFSRSNRMYLSYIAKLIWQIVFCIAGIVIILSLLFYQGIPTTTFKCPDDENEDAWPLPYNETVYCVFSPLGLLQKIWVVYVFLLILAVLFLLINLFNLIKWHTRELGFKMCAKFSFVTGIPYQHYELVPANTIKLTLYSHCFWKRVLKKLMCPFWQCSPYHIRSNYDFLVVKLFRTDSGLGYILKELHVARLLQMENNSELQRLSLYKMTSDASNEDFQEFVRGDTGWKLPNKDLKYEGPVLNHEYLTLPRRFLGVVLGCAMRCVGGYIPINILVDVAERCIEMTKEQECLAVDQLPPSDKPRPSDPPESLTDLFRNALRNKTTALQLKEDADTLIKEERSLRESEVDLAIKQKELSQCEHELELAIQRMKLARELVAAADASLNGSQEIATVSPEAIDQASVMVREQQGFSESAVESTAALQANVEKKSEKVINTTDKVNQPPKRLVDMLRKQRSSLVSAVEAAEDLRAHVEDKRKDILRITKEVKKLQESRIIKIGRLELETELDRLQDDLQALANKQHGYALPISDVHRLRALQLSGRHLVHALVIGFDMESQGIACALARIFSRVGFINFSSHYTNYNNPLKVLSNTPYIFSAVTPADILTKDDDLEMELSLDLKDTMHYTEKKKISEVALDDMKEVWLRGYRRAKRMDEIKSLKIELGIDSGDFEGEVKKLDLDKSNFIVIGPIMTTLQMATVNRVLSKNQGYLAEHSLILTIKPMKVGGKEMKYKDYKPPPPYEGPKHLNVKLLEKEGDVAEWPPIGSSLRVADKEYLTMNVEDTTVQVRYKLYRKRPNS